MPYVLIAEYEEVASDPQLEALHVFTDLCHPDHGRLWKINTPMSVDGEKKVTPPPAPDLGQYKWVVIEDLGCV